jgi:hypothetical protein
VIRVEYQVLGPKLLQAMANLAPTQRDPAIVTLIQRSVGLAARRPGLERGAAAGRRSDQSGGLEHRYVLPLVRELPRVQAPAHRDLW